MAQSCDICVETITKFRYEIECMFCEFTACCDCTKKYILNSSSPSCMNCKKPWNRKFLTEQFDKKFINKTLKQCREELLFDREKALFPATQVFVEAEIRREEINKEMYAISQKIKFLQHKYRTLSNEKDSLGNISRLEQITKVFIKSCAFQDCKGFLNKDWQCGLCKNQTCSDCHEIFTDDHKCNPNNVETAKLLSRDTKGCPNCGTQIFKIEGCDQMFCTQCHTPFSWRSGAIVRGVIHNPHYFDWLRNNPNQQLARNPNDIQCGREINNSFIRELMAICFNHKFSRLVTDICRNLIHIREVEFRNFQVDRIRNNRDLRIKYMRNLLTEEQFKRTLQKREKEIAKKSEIRDLLQMLNTCATDILFRLRDAVHGEQFIQFELENLREYVNTQFREISHVYGCKLYSLLIDYQLL